VISTWWLLLLLQFLLLLINIIEQRLEQFRSLSFNWINHETFPNKFLLGIR
jgi:hypothetical protein